MKMNYFKENYVLMKSKLKVINWNELFVSDNVMKWPFSLVFVHVSTQ